MKFVQPKEKYTTYAIKRQRRKSLAEAQPLMEAAWRLIDLDPPRNSERLITGYPEEFHGLQEIVVKSEYRLPNHGCLEILKVEYKPRGLARPAPHQYRRPNADLSAFRLY